MQSSKEQNSKSKRANKRRNSRKKSLSPTNFKALQQEHRSDKKFECKRSLSEGSAKAKHRKSNIRRTLSHPFTEKIPARSGDPDLVECVNSEVVKSVSEDRDSRSEPGAPPVTVDVARLPSVPAKEDTVSDESNLPVETSSDRDTEDERKGGRPAEGGAYQAKALLRFGRQQFAADSGSDLESLAASTVRRVSVRRRRAAPDTGSSSAKEEPVELESGRMRPEDYRLVFLSSEDSCREDNDDSSSTSSAAPCLTDDCAWDYFEPGGAGARPPAAPALPPPPPPPPRCHRACSCGAEPRIVAVPVPVPVPVPAALWPALLVYPDADAAQWSLFNFPKNFPTFRNFDAAELARLASRHAAAERAAAMAAGEQKLDVVDAAPGATEPELEQQAPRPDDAAQDETDAVEDVQRDAEDIEAVVESGGEVVGHLEAEKAFSSSSDSAESTDDEREAPAAERSYDLAASPLEPPEPLTSDAESDNSCAADGFSRVFVVNPADSSSEPEDDADSSGIDCSEGEDRSRERYDDITIEEALLNDKNSSRAGGTPDGACDDALRHDDRRTSKCSDFIKFCDLNMLRGEGDHRATVDRIDGAAPESVVGKTVSFADENVDASPGEEKENLVENAAGDSRVREKVKVYEADDRSGDSVRESETQESKINLSTGVTASPASGTASPVSRPASPGAADREPVLQIDLLKGIERTLSELLKNESSFERARDEEKTFSETSSGGASGAEGEGSPRSAARAPAAAAVSRPRPARADGPARYTSRVMITHDHVSVVTSDTTRIMRDVIVQHTNSQGEERAAAAAAAAGAREPEGGVRVVTNADTLSAVVCLEEGLADDDSWVEDVSHDEDAASSPTDSDSGDEAAVSPGRDDFTGYCRRSLDFTLHTIPEESCEESEPERARRSRPISATELEKYFFFGIGDGRHVARDEDDEPEETSSVCSEGADSGGAAGSDRGDDPRDPERLASSRLEKYFLSGFMGFSQERRDSDGSGSVGSDSEGRHSPEQRRKRLVRARGAPRSHSSSLDNLLAGEEAPADAPDDTAGSSTETEACRDSSERLDQADKRRKGKKTRSSPADDRRHSAEFGDDARDDSRSISEGEEGGRASPRQEFPPLGSDLSESKKQTSRDSGFVGSCDDLLRSGDSSAELRAEQRPELEEIAEELRPEAEAGAAAGAGAEPRAPSPLARKDSFNNWSSDEETNLMMTKMRQFFKTMVGSAQARTSTPAGEAATPPAPGSASARRPPKPPQLLYFESELTRLMKTVPGIRDEEVREIVEYLSSEDTWSDSYDSSDYAGSDLEGPGAGRSALRRQISESCREIIDEFDRGVGREPGAADAGLERDAACAYRKLVASLGRVAGEGASPRGSPPLVAKVMRHIGGRLVALMHEVSSGESAVASPRPRPPRRARPASAASTEDDDSASDAGAALPRSRSHDVLEAARTRGDDRDASDCDRFSWRGSFESALLAADSRGTLSGDAAAAARRSAGDLLAAQRTQSRSCGAIGGSEDRLWRGRRRSSAPDSEGAAEEEAEARAGSLPRLPSVAAAPVKSARYRAPGFSRAVRAVSAPGLHGLASRPRRRAAPPAPSPAAPPSTPSTPLLHEDAFGAELLSPGSATLPRRSNSPLPRTPPHDNDDLYRLAAHNRSGLQARSESMASVYSGAGEGARGAVSVRGAAQFSLVYNYKLGALEVGVRRCRDLAPVDLKRNRSDPYVKVYLLPDKSKCGKRKTKVKKNTLNPIFEEVLRFTQPLDALAARTLWLSVWSADMFGRNDFLGEVTLPLADMLFDDTAPKWYPLQERTEQFDEQQGSRGDVIVALKYELAEGARGGAGAGTLHVLVKEAKSLVATKPSGQADAFCKSYLLPDRGRLSKQKSAVVRRSLNPRWEHSFTYRGVAPHDLAQRALELSVWDRDRIASNDFMGGVRFSLGTGTYLGSSVNWMDSVGREVSLWQTMLQRPNFWVEGAVPLRSHLSN